MSEYYKIPDNIREPEPNPQEMDILIALGKNMGMARGRPKTNQQTKDVLSMESKMAAIAAAEVYNQSMKKIRRIIFSGGFTFGPDWNSEAQSMISYVRRLYPDIPEEVFMREESSLDTISQAKELKDTLDQNNLVSPEDKIGVIVSASHLKRVEKNLKDVGIKSHGFVTEDVLANTSKHHAKFIERYKASPLTMMDTAKEALLRSLESTTPGRKLIEHLTKRRAKSRKQSTIDSHR